MTRSFIGSLRPELIQANPNEESFSCGQAEDTTLTMDLGDRPTSDGASQDHAACNARINVLIEKQSKLLRRLEIAMMENQKTWNALEQSEERIAKLEREVEEERSLRIADVKNINKTIKDDALFKAAVKLYKEKTSKDDALQSQFDQLKLQVLAAGAKNMIKEHVSLALWGTNFCWVGATRNQWVMSGEASTVDFESARYMTFGHNGSWYRHYHVAKECKTEFSNNFASEYKELHQLLQGKSFKGCPACVSLGEKGRYFVRMKGVRITAGNLPPSCHEENRTLQQVENIWFGKNDTYISVSPTGSTRVELKGNYNEINLKTLVVNRRARLKAVALNLLDENSFVAVWDDGWASFGEGKQSFSGQAFKEWTASNFALSWAK